MAGEHMLLSGDQIATYSAAATSWPAPTYQTHLEFQGIAPLGDADSRFVLVRTQGEGDVITNGNLFTLHAAIDDGAGNLVPGAVVMAANFVTPDGYGGLGAGDDYLAFGMFGGQCILVRLEGFGGATSFVVTPGDDIAPGGDGEISISEITQAAPTDAPICFAAGTLIRTPTGDVAVQDLAVGDLVMTLDNGAQPLRWIGHQHLGPEAMARHPHVRPIRIRAGALGRDLPAADLLVSPQHRLLVRSRLARRMFGAEELLVAAKHLQQIEGIAQVAADCGSGSGVDYLHLLFDGHEIIFANDAEAESLFPGPEALRSIGAAARADLLAILPELDTGAKPATGPAIGDDRPVRAARGFVPAHKARQMAMRHARNHLHLVEGETGPGR